MERREHKRRRFWLPVEVDQLEQSFAVSHDASDGGILLVCNRELPVGIAVRLRFSIPPGSAHQVRVSGRVVRVAPNDEDPDGIWPFKMAVRFDEPLAELETFLAGLDPPASEGA